MKKALLITLLVLFSTLCFGQDGGPIKFLGIPIDGPEAQFIVKLKNKGFRYNSLSESYKGQFNGKDVDVYIHTNHDQVDRIYVAFPSTSEENIRNEYNRLLSQFQDIGKYMNLSLSEKIPEGEDITYEIVVNNKRYGASFSYFDANRDPAAFIDELVDKFSDYFSLEQRTKMKEYFKKSLTTPSEQIESLIAEMLAEMQETGTEQEFNSESVEENAFKFLVTFLDGMKSMADGEVWFMIHEVYGRYYIGLYYDNLHNQAHGEDL